MARGGGRAAGDLAALVLRCERLAGGWRSLFPGGKIEGDGRGALLVSAKAERLNSSVVGRHSEKTTRSRAGLRAEQPRSILSQRAALSACCFTRVTSGLPFSTM